MPINFDCSEDSDPLLSPGYHQPFSWESGPGYLPSNSNIYAYVAPIDDHYVIRVRGGYLRRRWWGAVQITSSEKQASKWKDQEKAEMWAEKHGYNGLK